MKRRAAFKGCLFTISAQASPSRFNLNMNTVKKSYSKTSTHSLKILGSLVYRQYNKEVCINPPIIEDVREKILPAKWKVLDFLSIHALAGKPGRHGVSLVE